MSNLVNAIEISSAQKQAFHDDGFLKLKGLLTTDAIALLKGLTSDDKQLKPLTSYYTGDFSRLGYDVEDNVTHAIYADENFTKVTKNLVSSGMTFTQGIGFELKPGNQGFAFHIDIVSYGFIQPEDLGYLLWIPLDPINKAKQNGGLAYVSRKDYCASNYFHLIHRLVQSSGLSDFCKTKEFEEFNFQYASEAESLVLEHNRIEDDFEIGLCNPTSVTSV